MLSAFIVLVVASVLCFSLFSLQGGKAYDAVRRNLGTRRRQSSGSSTSYQDVSSGAKESPSAEPKPGPTCRDIFPPSRRHVLHEVLPIEARRVLSTTPPDYSRLLPDKNKADEEGLSEHVSATGFTLDEIRRLGDFPDYAALSGIPLPKPYRVFDIATALPRPYRPFRWEYHQTMSLTKLEPDWWLELNRDYADVIRQRERLAAEHGEAVLRVLPGAEVAAKELMEICVQFLCARYPHYFRLDREKMALHNDILGICTDLRSTPAIEILLHNVPEDFAIMIRDPETGTYSFRGGIIMSSLGWNLDSKIGLKLHEIHDPIPDYKEKMRFSMDRYFAKKPTDRAIQRGSWGLEVDQPLYMPPGDSHALCREKQDPEHTVERIHLRVDWQTLRRLPLSGAIVFNFKALFTPISEFRDEPYVPALLLKVLREGKHSLMEYKNTWHTEHVAIPALEEYEREQIASGLMAEADWEARTLDETPFFPGWEEKWHRQQGF